MKVINMMDQDRVDAMIFDYLEGEMDPSMKADFQSWLQKDEALQKRVRDLGGVRKQLKSLDWSADFEAKLNAKIESRLDDLNAKIMAKVEKSKPRSRWVVIATEVHVWRTAAAVAFALLATIAVMKVVAPQGSLRGGSQFAQRSDKSTNQITVGQMMVDASIRSPEVVGEEGLSSEDQVDMYMDIMAKRMGKMDDRENKQLMDTLKQ